MEDLRRGLNRTSDHRTRRRVPPAKLIREEKSKKGWSPVKTHEGTLVFPVSPVVGGTQRIG